MTGSSNESAVGRFVHRFNPLSHLKQVVIIVGAYFVYMFVRRFLLADPESAALDNAVRLISFELAAHIFWEATWQDWAIGASHSLITFFNWAYILTFFPVILTTAVIVYMKDRPKYFYFRNVILLSFTFALALFVLFPLAPPRFLPEYGFVDSIQRFGPNWYGGRDMAVYYNAFAAMPSLHFGWTVGFGILFFSMKPLPIKVLGVLYPTLTLFAITITANHYIMDAVGGAAMILASFGTYELLRRFNPVNYLRAALARLRLAEGLRSRPARVATRTRLLASTIASNFAQSLKPDRSAARNGKRGLALFRLAVRPKRT